MIKFIIIEGVDVSFFKEKEDAERYMEAVDVINSEYIGFRFDGAALEIKPRGQSAEIRIDEQAPKQVPKLQDILRRYLKQFNIEARDVGLNELLALCETARHDRPERRWWFF